ncbi:hypothetical protein [Parabacteroides sp. AM08-6]|uniref:hypothetical protein n=1 Tax=Parabacteroides sp. AM08-6 TaxID=2292053 RepID=UPI000EFF6811|nr:hypothetical protein [Parabacteroides sp. AM08-6]RHJ83498.1 hypothetical protein DW103_07170 [Parabacteroides sp. AM08-6]
MEANTNPVATLLQQALGLMSNNVTIPVSIDYEAITKAAIKTVEEERKKIYSKVLITQNEADSIYTKQVIRALVKRGHLQQYKFDFRDAVDREGNPIRKTKGAIYYRVEEIEKSIEKGNVLSGTRRGTI